MAHLELPELGSLPGFFSSTHAFNEIRMGVEPADFAARVQPANKAAACKNGSGKAGGLLFDRQ
ncbi:hypothetical protein H3S85_02780 [Bartonella sp. M0187]|uniref:hypothetical protein n=1 Tax=Bartonella apihabitans TaxID=2750929 RepID=UPI0018DCA727|nr:hypothetical protein [Bartonella apihabitans]MBI0025381.1 hypothetical protein [Bartonella apihabitans]